MAKNLVIVESPNKIKKIESFLGKDWEVTASVGHIRDLKIYGTQLHLGIDLDTMEPLYMNIKDKAEVIHELGEKAEKAETIYIATDPDREGEAIGWHVVQVIKEHLKENGVKLPTFKRIAFNEITKEAVAESIEHPTKIDMKLVEAQEARRMLDRMIGFRLSSLSKKKIQAQSAGRVKSVVLKMIIEREKEITAFKPDYWWTINGEIKKDEVLINVDKDYKEFLYKTEKTAKETLKNLSGEFEYIESKQTNRTINPPKPLEMATYLMGMYSTYGMSNSPATYAAQSLYEKGLISYPRTDSTRISSKDFIAKSKKEITNLFGKESYAGLPVAKKGGQDAHEAIRPVTANVTPMVVEGLKPNEKKAYTFIWNTTMKSMMVQGKNLAIREIYKDGKDFFVLKKSVVIEPGFRVVEGIVSTEYKEPKKTIKIDKKKLEVKENSTKPPARYNQSSIIKKMKEEGIGRPSTYSATTWGLIQFKYVDRDGGALIPTELGDEVNDLLINKANFGDIINTEYTSQLEKDLDKIASGDAKKEPFLKKFWKGFGDRVETAEATIEVKPPVFIGRKCPECKEGELVKKRGRFGLFIACHNYPECKHSEPLVKKPKPIAIKESEHGACPECQSPLIARDSRYGTKFIGCSAFPKCKYIMQKEKTQEILLDMGLVKEAAKKNTASKPKKKRIIRKVKK